MSRGFGSVSGRVLYIGPARAQPVPIQMDASFYIGVWVYGEDGEFYYSNGEEWRPAAPDPLRPPRIREPQDGQTVSKRQPWVKAGGFAPLYSVDMPDVKRRVQIAAEDDPEFAEPLVDRVLEPEENEDWPEEAQEGLWYRVPDFLSLNTTYRVRMQDFTDEDVSPWSNEVVFTLPAAIATPQPLSPTAGAETDLRPTLVATEFETVVSEDSHDISEFELSRWSESDEEWTTIWTEETSGPTTARTVPEELLDSGGQRYSWRVRYRGTSHGWSAWSAQAEFETFAIRVRRPELTSPSDEATVDPDDIVLQTASISWDNDDESASHASTRWEVVDLANGDTVVDTGWINDLTSYEIASFSLEGGRTYQWRAAHRDNMGRESDWSTQRLFTVAVAGIVAPTAASPDSTAERPLDDVTLSASAFSTENVTDTHVNSRFQVINASTGDVVVDTDGQSLGATTSFIVGAGDLESGTQYNWRVRYEGEELGWSGWSNTASFVIEITKVDTPSTVSPEDGATNVSVRPTLVSSSFSTTNLDVDHDDTQFRILEPGTTNEIRNSGPLGPVTEWLVPTNTLEFGERSYDWQVRHRGEGQDWTPWSEPSRFTTAEEPEILFIGDSDGMVWRVDAQSLQVIQGRDLGTGVVTEITRDGSGYLYVTTRGGHIHRVEADTLDPAGPVWEEPDGSTVRVGSPSPAGFVYFQGEWDGQSGALHASTMQEAYTDTGLARFPPVYYKPAGHDEFVMCTFSSGRYEFWHPDLSLGVIGSITLDGDSPRGRAIPDPEGYVHVIGGDWNGGWGRMVKLDFNDGDPQVVDDRDIPRAPWYLTFVYLDGRIYLAPGNADLQWVDASDYSNGSVSSEGSMHLCVSQDGQYIYGADDTSIYQYDKDLNRVRSASLEGIDQINAIHNNLPTFYWTGMWD